MDFRKPLIASAAPARGRTWPRRRRAGRARVQLRLRPAQDRPATALPATCSRSTIGELSGGSMKINQFPGAQLGQEPVMLQKVRSGDIDFIITSSANGATRVARARRDVAALPVRGRGPSRQGGRLARAQRRDQAAGRGHGRGRPCADRDDARLPQHLLQGGGPRASTTSTARRSASRRPRPRTPTSRPTAPSRCTCRSARSTPRSRPAWSTWPRTASTSTSRTSTTRWRR